MDLLFVSLLLLFFYCFHQFPFYIHALILNRETSAYKFSKWKLHVFGYIILFWYLPLHCVLTELKGKLNARVLLMKKCECDFFWIFHLVSRALFYFMFRLFARWRVTRLIKTVFWNKNAVNQFSNECSIDTSIYKHISKKKPFLLQVKASWGFFFFFWTFHEVTQRKNIKTEN